MLGKELIERPQLWQLVLEVSTSGLEVMAFTHFEDNSLLFEKIPFDKSAPTLLRALEDAVYDNPMLLLDFKQVFVIFHTNRFIALPEADEPTTTALFRRVFPHDTSNPGEVLINNIAGMETQLAFEVPTDLLSFMRRTFHNATMLHSLVPTAEWFQAKHPTRRRGKMMVNINGSRLDIIVLGDSAPLALTSRSYVEPMDALYFILSTRQQLLIRDSNEVVVAGDRVARAALTPLLRRYVRYVMPAIYPSVMFRAGKASLSAPLEMVLAPLTVQ